MPRDDGPSGTLEELSRRLSAVEARLAVLEGESPSAAAAGPASPAVEQGGAPAAALPAGFVAFLGRTLVVLGGGYLLRAAADTGAVPVAGAAIAGLGYALAWLLRAATEGAKAERRASATFHGLAALLIALPLVLETTLRFRAFSPAAGTLAVVTTATAALVVGRRHELFVLRWAGVTLGVAAALVLLVGARDPLPIGLGLLGFAATVEALTTWRHQGLRWPAAAGANLALATTVALATRPEGPPEGYAALPPALVAVAALLLPLIYLGSAASRTLAAGGHPGIFEALQVPAALLVGLGGAAKAFHAGAIPTGPVGAAALALGAGCYLLAFSVIDRRSEQAGTFYGYTTVGGVLTAVGCVWLAGGAGLAAALGSLGLAGVFLGLRSGRRTLAIHGALFLLGGCAAAGLFAIAWLGLLSSAGFEPPSLGLAGVGALSACAAAYIALVRRPGALPEGGFISRLLLASGLAFFGAGVASLLLQELLGWAIGRRPEAALLASARTAVLSLLAVALAALARRARARELARLVPVCLVATGIKLLVEDLRLGSPASLFLTLAVYGGALIGTARIGASSET